MENFDVNGGDAELYSIAAIAAPKALVLKNGLAVDINSNTSPLKQYSS